MPKDLLTSPAIFNKTPIPSQTIIAEASVTVENDMEFMNRYFEKRPYETVLLDHTDGFEEKVIPMEIRSDRITGRVSRVLAYRRRRFQESSHDAAFIEKSRKFCPFCPENLETSTPRFPEWISREGRIHLGESTVLPNAFPYSRYCGLTIFSDHHYISLDKMTPGILENALKASVLFIDRISVKDSSVAYASINWNYMMAAGGGIAHPHFQVVVNQYPTRFQDRLIHESATHRQSFGSHYWSDLIRFEKETGRRYIFGYGNIDFLSVYSPGGMFGEVLAVFTPRKSMGEIIDADWRSFAEGLSRILKCFGQMHLDNLNMSILLNLKEINDFWIQARIIPRRVLTPQGTSDVNYFEKGHDEGIVIISPEDLAGEIRNTG